MTIAKKYKKDAWFGQASSAYYGVLYPRTRPVKEVVQPLQHAYKIGLLAGDIEGALVSRWC